MVNYNKVSKNRHPSRMLSHLIWEKHYGKIPKGYIIHHKDKDITNDRIENLECVSRKEHTLIHLNKIPNKSKKLLRMALKSKNFLRKCLFFIFPKE